MNIPTPITTLPVRASRPRPMEESMLYSIWLKLPEGFKEWFKQRLKRTNDRGRKVNVISGEEKT